MRDSSSHERGVSRRAFVAAAGASGVAGLAGCTDDQGGGTDGGGGTTRPGTTTGQGNAGKTVVRWAADSLAKENADALTKAMHDAGLDDSIQVEIIAGAWETGKRQNQYQQWLSAGRENPDILMMDSGWQQAFIARDQCQNLSKMLSSDLTSKVKDQYLDLMVASAQGNNGDLYGVPLFPTMATMLYRKDLVKEAGYDPGDWATNPMSWQRFSKVTKDTLENASDSKIKYGWTFQAKAYEGLSCCDFNEWLSSFGGAYFGSLDNLFGPVGNRPVTVDEPPVAKSLRAIRTFIYGSDSPVSLSGYEGNIAPSAVLQWSEEPSRKPFTNGEAVMHRNWPYAIKLSGAEKALGKDLGVMPLPYGVKPGQAQYEGTGGTCSALGGWNLAVNPNSTNKDAATKVLAAVTKDSYQLSQFKAIGWLPPKAELMISEEARQVPIIGRYLDSIQVAAKNAIPRPATAVWPQESTKIYQQANSVLSQDVKPAPGMDDLAKELKAIENKYG